MAFLGFGKKNKKPSFDDYDDEDYGSDLDEFNSPAPQKPSAPAQNKGGKPLDKKEQKRLEQEEKKKKYLEAKAAKEKEKAGKAKAKGKDSAKVAKGRLQAEKKGKGKQQNSAFVADDYDDFEGEIDLLNTPAKMNGYNPNVNDDDGIDEEELMGSVASLDTARPNSQFTSTDEEDSDFDIFKTFEDEEVNVNDTVEEPTLEEPRAISFSEILQEDTSGSDFDLDFDEDKAEPESDFEVEKQEETVDEFVEQVVPEESKVEEVKTQEVKPSLPVFEEVRFDDGVVDVSPASMGNVNQYTPLDNTLNSMREELSNQVDEEIKFHLDYANNLINRVFESLDKTTKTPYYQHIVLESLFTDELIKIYRSDKYKFSKINEFTILTREVPAFSKDVRISMMTKHYFDFGKKSYEVDQIKTIPLSPTKVKVLNYTLEDLELIAKTRPVVFFMSPLGTPLDDIKLGVKWNV